jgi:tetratricopeptide (TPR) repeat protein
MFLPVILSLAAAEGCAHAIDRDQSREKIVELNWQALAAYQEDDFDTALTLLTRALTEAKRAGWEHDRLMARTQVHLGAVYLVGYGNRAMALQSFAAAKQIRPNIHMTPALATPALLALFAQVPSGPQRNPAPKPVGVIEPDLPADFRQPVVCGNPRVWHPGEALFIRCAVAPNVKAESVRMHFRPTAEEDFQTILMQVTPKGWYVATIPRTVTETYNIQVYFEARDLNGLEVATHGKVDRPLIIRICEDEWSCDLMDLCEAAHDNCEIRPDSRRER